MFLCRCVCKELCGKRSVLWTMRADMSRLLARSGSLRSDGPKSGRPRRLPVRPCCSGFAMRVCEIPTRSPTQRYDTFTAHSGGGGRSIEAKRLAQGGRAGGGEYGAGVGGLNGRSLRVYVCCEYVLISGWGEWTQSRIRWRTQPGPPILLPRTHVRLRRSTLLAVPLHRALGGHASESSKQTMHRNQTAASRGLRLLVIGRLQPLKQLNSQAHWRAAQSHMRRQCPELF